MHKRRQKEELGITGDDPVKSQICALDMVKKGQLHIHDFAHECTQRLTNITAGPYQTLLLEDSFPIYSFLPRPLYSDFFFFFLLFFQV